MRTSWLYTVVSVILLGLDSQLAIAERQRAVPRQEASSSLATSASTSLPAKSSASLQSTDVYSNPSVSSVPSSSFSNAAASTSSAMATNDPSHSVAMASKTLAAASTFIGATASPIPKGSLNVTSVNNTVIIKGLPIQPTITPGLSIAGVLMILTGAFYTIIGIRTRWLQISLSCAYLVSLAVTVLIIYVMHPPISNGLQGGLVVAAIMPGIILGALAVIFKDITEGFACFVGGFCLSMWFLVLRSGGLITSEAGKVIFIALLTAGAFLLYISHHTRPYGLIGSTSFGGATVIVLGTDCFSRAGLKEFWVYIWSLNDSLFPLHYHQRYPITRGIRVEIAAIIIISLMGIMSQLRVWKIVKEKREARASEQKRKERERNLSDEERGKRVEASNQQDRPLWEALHGEKGKTRVQEGYLDSGIGTDEPSSTRKSSWGDVRDTNTEGMEMHDMTNSQKGPSDGGRVTVHVGQDDFYETSLVGGQRTSLDHHMLGSTTGASTQAASETSSTKGTAKGATTIVDPHLTLQPKVVPPPFRIPDLEPASDDDGSSVEASAPSDHLPDRGSKRIPGATIMEKLTNRSRNNYHAASTSDMTPYADDDQASSIAATHDDRSDHGECEDALNFSRSQTPVIEQALDHESLEALVAVSHNHVSDLDMSVTHIPESVALPSSRPTSMAFNEPSNEHDRNSLSPSETSEDVTERLRLSGNLPSGGSKVVTAYRTNEWAKHLEGADVPEVDELKVNKRQAQGTSQLAERAVPVDVSALQQTSLSAEPAPIVQSPLRSWSQTIQPPTKHRPSKNPFSRHSKQQEPPPKTQRVLHPLTIAKNMERNPSQSSLPKPVSRTSSQTSLDSTGSHGNINRPSHPKFRSSQSSPVGANRGFRSSSGPLATSPLVESPIQEDVESSFPNKRFTPHDAHLMSQRDRIISSKPSSTSLLRTSYSNVALDQHPAYRSMGDEETENLSLAQRKSLLQQNPHAIPPPHRSSSSPSRTTNTPAHFSPGTTTPLPINPPRSSSNPYRASSSTPISAAERPAPVQRNSTISAWRESLKPNTSAQYEHQTMENRRSDLLREKQRESTSRVEKQMGRDVRASVLDQGMRRGDMLSAHQAAMRKLQGEVKI